MGAIIEQIEQKLSNDFCCIKCDYTTSRHANYKRHLQTDRHQRGLLGATIEQIEQHDNIDQTDNNALFQCICGNTYRYSKGLSRHKLNCVKNTTTDKEMILMLVKQNALLMEQNTELVVMLKSSDVSSVSNANNINNINNVNICNNNSNNNNINNNNNNTFNLHIFLNETCKDAMNVMDFVDSIHLQLSDLETVGEVGYAQGIANIITNKLKSLDVSMRPVHCTDQKRETIYIKHDNKWEKDDDKKTRLRRLITHVANKNKKLIPQFREKYPEYKNSKLTISDKYDKMVLEAMGGPHVPNVTDTDIENKIIRTISKCIVVDKMH